MKKQSNTEMALAIVGMAGRFPDADNVRQFWDNLVDGRRSIRFFSAETAQASGVKPELLYNPNYVKAGVKIEDVDRFDAPFFGITPREAETMDPQTRLFLQSAWESLEDAGYNPHAYEGLIGVFAGKGFSNYMGQNLYTNPEVMEMVGKLQIAIGNERDSLASMVAYKMNLRGPSVSVQTFCSTSMVAVHLACQSLLTYECNMALAGGVAIPLPQDSGYLYQEGGILSPDGVVRTFDANANGSVMGAGLGVVTLKRYEDALADGDQIYALILGSATNNDGIARVGFTAPGLRGQSAVMLEALGNAGVSADTISYVEAHGTGTSLGDSIELAAMVKAFRSQTKRVGYCKIGSVKPNIGHLDRASGVTGLIKTAMSLKHKQLPAVLNFEQASADIALEQSPFVVNTALSDWTKPEDAPRRAGVSSFGLGGVNAHVVLEEVPERPDSSASRDNQLLMLSARSEAALDDATQRLGSFLAENPEVNLADAAYTLQIGRMQFNHRRILVATGADDAQEALLAHNPRRIFSSEQSMRNRQVAFLLPGVGDHYPEMARGLYETEAAFRTALDTCAELLQPLLDADLRDLLFADEATETQSGELNLRQMVGRESAETSPLHQTKFAQPIVFAVEYALVQLLVEWGIRPKSIIGYSLGEYTAACIAGVLSLDDALTLVAKRAALIDTVEAGGMLAVSGSAETVRPHLPKNVAIASIPTPNTVIVAGPLDAIEAAADAFAAAKLTSRPVPTTHAFHSPMMATISEPFRELLATVTFNKPAIPYVSNVTGTWITAAQAADPSYWVRHLCQTVRFADGAATMLSDPHTAMLEVGPGQALASFVKQHPDCDRDRWASILPTLRARYDNQNDQAFLLQTAGRLWLAGVTIDWDGFYTDETRYRTSLPTYPFEKFSYWIETRSDEEVLHYWLRKLGVNSNESLMAQLPTEVAEVEKQPLEIAEPVVVTKNSDMASWFYQPVWQEAALADSEAASSESWLIFADSTGVCDSLLEQLRTSGAEPIVVQAGDKYAQHTAHSYTLRIGQAADYVALFHDLLAHELAPQRIVHAWSIADAALTFDEAQTRGLYSLIFLAQGWDGVQPSELLVLTQQMQAVQTDELPDVNVASIIAACKSLPQEYAGLTCRAVDVDSGVSAETLLAELNTPSDDLIVAYRGDTRFALSYDALPLDEPDETPLKRGGVYLITGGMGGIGMLIARHLAQSLQARIALVGRSPLPPREEWDDLLMTLPDSDRLHEKLTALTALEAMGANVLTLAADVSDVKAMRAALAETVAEFGQIDGVLHAAGISDGSAFNPVQVIEPAQCEMHFRPKVHGLNALYDALSAEAITPDFCLLFSSLSSVLAGIGFVGYTASNAYMDAWAQRHNRQLPDGTPVYCVNWDTWHLREGQHDILGGTIAQFEMSAEEGVASLERILAQSVRHVVQSTGDLAQRYRQWIHMDALAHSGKRGGRANARPNLATSYVQPGNALESELAEIWQDLLGIDQVGVYDNFFDLGGNSLIGLQVIARIKAAFGVQVPIVALFEAPTISTLTKYLADDDEEKTDTQTVELAARRKQARGDSAENDIAIIAMSARFPGADNVEAFWQNLCAGVESIAQLSDEQLQAAGVPAILYNQPNYIKARPVVEDAAMFDAHFFGYSPREAELTDPQHRVFLECTWEAMERAGYDVTNYKGLIGVFGGSNISAYLLDLIQDPEFGKSLGAYEAAYQVVVGNDRDSLATNTSYKLNLRGPSVAVQTFCSTSLVATHLACQSLRAGECDMAMAGGVSIRTPIHSGYMWHEGGQESHDGHCRAFDAESTGTLFGDGSAVVVLKRLSDAIADGDTIHAVIKGSAMNNDGSLKAGYAAPSVEGQSDVVAMALEHAGVSAESISYVECHGTGTRVGDPIEMAALTKAFRQTTDNVGYCAVGSVKTNIGHLDRASGASGLIKTALAIEHGLIPPTLHYSTPNPEIDFETSPFYVNTDLRPWQAMGDKRLGGVSSLGMGGTNVHIVLEEPPQRQPSSPSRQSQLIVLSAKTESALQQATANLARHLRENPEEKLADIAYTLQVGRAQFAWRRTLVAQSSAAALEQLQTTGDDSAEGRYVTKRDSDVAFVMPFWTAQLDQFARELYEAEPVFREAIDACSAYVQANYGLTLVSDGERDDLKAVQAVAIGFALVALLNSWGIRPKSVLGNPISAAQVAGVFSIEAALTLAIKPAGFYDSFILHEPKIDVAVDAEWVDAAQAVDEQFWVQAARAAAPETLPSLSPLLTILALGEATAEQEIGLLVSAEMTAQANLLDALGKLWTEGVSVDWHGFYQHETRHRMTLPTYPFERTLYWIEPRNRYSDWKAKEAAQLAEQNGGELPAVEPERDFSKMGPEDLISEEPPKIEGLENWFYLPTWERAAPLPTVTQSLLELSTLEWLIFADGCGVADAVARELRHGGHRVTMVRPNGEFAVFDTDEYSLRPRERADYEELMLDLMMQNRMPDRIAHFWSVDDVTESGGLGSAEIEQTLDHGFYSLMALTQALGDLGAEQNRVHIISSDMQDVIGADTLQPVKATLMGATKVVPQEYTSIDPRSVDITLSDRRPQLVQAILRELIDEANEDYVVAIRGGQRWVQKYEPHVLPEGGYVQRIKRDGVYMITGGMGGIGLGLAGWLSAEFGAKVALLGRSPLPPTDEWDEIIARQGSSAGLGYRLHTLQTLQAAGAEVLPVQADITDRDQLAGAIAEIEQALGPINGLIHAAAVPASGIIQLKEPEMATEVLAPKLTGTLLLHELLQGQPLDFFLMFSSMSAATGGGPGQIDYCAANAFMDAFARRFNAENGVTISVGWGEWLWDAWDAGLEGFPPEARIFFKAKRREFGLSFEDGFECLRRILNWDIPHVVVATQDFRMMVAGCRDFSIASILEKIKIYRSYMPKHPRPALGQPYVAPSTPMEEAIANLWGDQLGIDGVGVHDNFFDLGGNSLLGVDMIARLRDELGVEGLPVHILYETPSVALLAEMIESGGEADEDDSAEITAQPDDRAQKRREQLSRKREEDESEPESQSIPAD